MFAFDVHPAYITIGGGIGTAWRFLGASWRRWLPVVVVVTVAELAVSSLFTSDLQTLWSVDQDTGRVVWSQDVGGKVGPLTAASVGLSLLSLIASWVFTAIAIAGLRNRPLSISWIVGRGLRALWANLLLGIAALCVGVAAFIVLAVLATATGPLAVFAGFAAIVVAIYVVIRVIFTELAIFDGRGPIEGIFESWHLSDQSVLRLFGWGLMVGLISFGVVIAAGIASAPFQSRLTLLAQAISTFATQIAACFQVFLMAVLYESQRTRRDLTLAAQQAGPYQPSPYPPGWHSTGPYAPGPYPTGSRYAAGPYPPGPYPPGPGYPMAPYPPGPYPPGPYAPPPGWPADQSTGLASADTRGPIEPPPPAEPDRS